MSDNGSHTAEVTALTAEVRALMVGSRQVTLSVYRQLDEVEDDETFEPFGRVRDGHDGPGLWMVGKHKPSGSLTRASIHRPRRRNRAAPTEWHHLLLHARLRKQPLEDVVLRKDTRFDFGLVNEDAEDGLEVWWGTSHLKACTLGDTSVPWPKVTGECVSDDYLWDVCEPVMDGHLNELRTEMDHYRLRESLPLIVLAGLR